jgi:large subunit ribosomal protein L5
MSEGKTAVVQQSMENPISQIEVGKVTVNISVGRSGEELEKAVQVLENLTGQKPQRRTAKRSVRDFGIRAGESIACIVTLRKERAISFLKQAFNAVGDRIPASYFDDYGNFSFGIKEHIEIPGTRYVPELGIFGMDVCVVLEKPGSRVRYRSRRSSRVGRRQRVNKQEAQSFITENFGITIT